MLKFPPIANTRPVVCNFTDTLLIKPSMTMITTSKAKLLVFVAANLLFVAAYSQSTTLDTKRGFKNFTIGDNKTKFDGNLEYFKTTSEGNTGYKYKPKTLSETYVFNYEFNLILLFFDKENKLVTINLVKEYDKDSYAKATEELTGIIKNLTGLFGPISEKYQDDKESRIGAAWAGNEIILMCTNKYSGYNVGSQTEIMISKYNKADAVGF